MLPILRLFSLSSFDVSVIKLQKLSGLHLPKRLSRSIVSATTRRCVSKASAPALGIIEDPTEWVPRPHYLGLKHPELEAKHFQLVSKLRISEAVPLVPHVFTWHATRRSYSPLNLSYWHFLPLLFKDPYFRIREADTDHLDVLAGT